MKRLFCVLMCLGSAVPHETEKEFVNLGVKLVDSKIEEIAPDHKWQETGSHDNLAQGIADSFLNLKMGEQSYAFLQFPGIIIMVAKSDYVLEKSTKFGEDENASIKKFLGDQSLLNNNDVENLVHKRIVGFGMGVLAVVDNATTDAYGGPKQPREEFQIHAIFIYITDGYQDLAKRIDRAEFNISCQAMAFGIKLVLKWQKEGTPQDLKEEFKVSIFGFTKFDAGKGTPAGTVPMGIGVEIKQSFIHPAILPEKYKGLKYLNGADLSYAPITWEDITGYHFGVVVAWEASNKFQIPTDQNILPNPKSLDNKMVKPILNHFRHDLDKQSEEPETEKAEEKEEEEEISSPTSASASKGRSRHANDNREEKKTKRNNVAHQKYTNHHPSDDAIINSGLNIFAHVMNKNVFAGLNMEALTSNEKWTSIAQSQACEVVRKDLRRISGLYRLIGMTIMIFRITPIECTPNAEVNEVVGKYIENILEGCHDHLEMIRRDGIAAAGFGAKLEYDSSNGTKTVSGIASISFLTGVDAFEQIQNRMKTREFRVNVQANIQIILLMAGRNGKKWVKELHELDERFQYRVITLTEEVGGRNLSGELTPYQLAELMPQPAVGQTTDRTFAFFHQMSGDSDGSHFVYSIFERGNGTPTQAQISQQKMQDVRDQQKDSQNTPDTSNSAKGSSPQIFYFRVKAPAFDSVGSGKASVDAPVGPEMAVVSLKQASSRFAIQSKIKENSFEQYTPEELNLINEVKEILIELNVPAKIIDSGTFQTELETFAKETTQKGMDGQLLSPRPAAYDILDDKKTSCWSMSGRSFKLDLRSKNSMIYKPNIKSVLEGKNPKFDLSDAKMNLKRKNVVVSAKKIEEGKFAVITVAVLMAK